MCPIGGLGCFVSTVSASSGAASSGYFSSPISDCVARSATRGSSASSGMRLARSTSFETAIVCCKRKQRPKGSRRDWGTQKPLLRAEPSHDQVLASGKRAQTMMFYDEPVTRRSVRVVDMGATATQCVLPGKFILRHPFFSTWELNESMLPF